MSDGHRGGPVIHTTDVTKRYGDQLAVDQLTLTVPPGTIFGFIGPSGSGKSTTVKLLTGIARPTAGTVSVLGTSPARFTTADRIRIGYLPQLSVLYPHLSLQENLQFTASIYGLPRDRDERLNRALDFVELGPHRRKRLRDTSGGMQRRLALAACLLHDPELLFLDEPTAGIDPVLRRKFWQRFEELRAQGRTLFVTTQYVGEAAYCDVVGVVARGQLVAVDTPEGLRRRAFGGDVVALVTTTVVAPTAYSELRRLPFVHSAEPDRSEDRGLKVVVDDADSAIPDLTRILAAAQIEIETIREGQPPFDDVFVELVREPEQP